MDKQTLVRVIGVSGVAFGAAALLAPAAVGKAYGLPVNDSATYLGRQWGTRTAAMNALGLMNPDDAMIDRHLMIGVGMNLVDATCSVIAGQKGQVPRHAAYKSAATSAFFAGLCAYTRSLS
jgi:hypothetical protein